MRLDDSTYRILKWVTMIVLPAIGTFYFALCGIWGLPYGEQICGTITAIVTLCGVILGVSTKNYNDLENENANGKEFDNPFGDYDIIEEGDENADS